MTKYTHIVLQDGDAGFPKAITLRNGNIMSTPAHSSNHGEGLYDGDVVRLSKKHAEKLAAAVRKTGTVLPTRVALATEINPRNTFVNRTAN